MVKLKGSSSMGLHHGEAIMHVVGTYPTMYFVSLEMTQNGIDAGATIIRINFNQKTRSMTFSDNGLGVSKEEFDLALSQVCKSRKSQDKLGRYGVGMVSPLGKCEQFTFTSKSSNGGPYMTWVFKTEDIKAQSNPPSIPCTTRPDLHFGKGARSGSTSVQWRTEIRLEKISTDRVIGEVDIEKLAEGIRERFGIPMRKNGIEIHITVIDKDGKSENKIVTARDFEGKPLPEWSHHDEDSNTTTAMKLFVARKSEKGRKGKVLIGEADNDYRMSFHLFARSVTEYLDAEIIAAIGSGVFEGEILTQAKLHLSRKEFHKDTALLGLCIAIEKWFKEVGHKYLKEVREAKQDERYQELGLRSMRVIEGLLHDANFANLKDVLSTFKKGTVGPGHADVPEKKIEGTQTVKSLSTQGKHGTQTDGASGTGNPEKEHKGHSPFSVIGPHGRNRTVVRSSSLGIQFAHVHMNNPNKIAGFKLLTQISDY